MKLQTVDHCLFIRRLAMVLGLLLFLSTAAPVHAAGDEEAVALNFLKFLGSDKAILSEELMEQSLLVHRFPP